jgi:hypothetical protein
MSGIHILPNFEVKTGGVMGLRVVTLDFLRQKGFDPHSGFGFSKEQSDRYGGKKLKLYKVFTDPDCVQGPGCTRRLSFSADGDDTYQWNEYMFQEYWDAIGNGAVAREATPSARPAKPVAPKPVASKPVAQKPVEEEQPKPFVKNACHKKSSNMVKMLILMSLLNQSKTSAPATPAPAPASKSARPKSAS